MDKNFVPTPSGTDITKRWELLYGYVPASKQPQTLQKWKDFKAEMARDLESQYEV